MRHLTVTEVAWQLAVDPRTVRNEIARGRLVAIRVGRSLRIAQTDLDTYMRQRKREAS